MRQIDWKHLATTPGYISLKKAYIGSLTIHHAEKKEAYELFRWIICRATHFAIVRCLPIEVVLNQWEEDRSYGLLNYYNQSMFHKLHNHYPRYKQKRPSLKKRRWSKEQKLFNKRAQRSL